MSVLVKDEILRAHLRGRLHTLDILEGIADNYDSVEGPEAIRRVCKLVREVVIRQAALEGINV